MARYAEGPPCGLGDNLLACIDGDLGIWPLKPMNNALLGNWLRRIGKKEKVLEDNHIRILVQAKWLGH